ncbi:MAG TPA: hypothetical protein VEW46_02735 [Pyrinomonadaceae bacterium]|nr:hypothetical protein [Pyrinomonadaceae bacterium]
MILKLIYVHWRNGYARPDKPESGRAKKLLDRLHSQPYEASPSSAARFFSVLVDRRAGQPAAGVIAPVQSSVQTRPFSAKLGVEVDRPEGWPAHGWFD